MSDSEFVLVKSKEGAGAHFTVPRATYDAHPEDYVALKSDALDHNGQPKPTKYPISTPPASAESKSGSAASTGPTADTSKEK